MTTDDITRIAENALHELKAMDVQILDVSGLTTVTDTMIIASGNSDRQVRGLADNVVKRAKENGIRPLGVEGGEQAEWVLVDLGDVIVHIMHPGTRAYYQLEKLWTTEHQHASTVT